MLIYVITNIAAHTKLAITFYFFLPHVTILFCEASPYSEWIRREVPLLGTMPFLMLSMESDLFSDGEI
jgi:hypothetical protein